MQSIAMYLLVQQTVEIIHLSPRLCTYCAYLPAFHYGSSGLFIVSFTTFEGRDITPGGLSTYPPSPHDTLHEWC